MHMAIVQDLYIKQPMAIAPGYGRSPYSYRRYRPSAAVRAYTRAQGYAYGDPWKHGASWERDVEVTDAPPPVPINWDELTDPAS